MFYDMHTLKLWYVSPPGETLAEKLEEMGLDAKELAFRTGYTPKTINELLKAKCRVTPEMALNLEIATGISQSAWLNMQMMYDEFICRKKIEESLKNQAKWPKFFPIAELNPRKWIDDINKNNGVLPILKYFGISTPKAWKDYYFGNRLKVAFRISLAETEDPYAASVWLRRGEILADQIQMESRMTRRCVLPSRRRCRNSWNWLVLMWKGGRLCGAKNLCRNRKLGKTLLTRGCISCRNWVRRLALRCSMRRISSPRRFTAWPAGTRISRLSSCTIGSRTAMRSGLRSSMNLDTLCSTVKRTFSSRTCITATRTCKKTKKRICSLKSICWRQGLKRK